MRETGHSELLFIVLRECTISPTHWCMCEHDCTCMHTVEVTRTLEREIQSSAEAYLSALVHVYMYGGMCTDGRIYSVHACPRCPIDMMIMVPAGHHTHHNDGTTIMYRPVHLH